MTERRQQRANTTLRVPRDLLARIDQEAHNRQVSRTWLIERLLREGLEHLKPLDGSAATRLAEALREDGHGPGSADDDGIELTGLCGQCNEPWPCDAGAALASYDAALEVES